MTEMPQKQPTKAWQESSQRINDEACSSAFALKKGAILKAFVFLCFAVLLLVTLRPPASAHSYTDSRPVRAAERCL